MRTNIDETYDRKYKNFHEIQETREFRNHDNIDYYDTKNVCVIHFKFGHARKGFSGLRLENNLTQEFIDEYLKYFDGKGNKIKDARDLVEYVVKNNLPVIFYGNFNDEEMGIEEVTDWLIANVLWKDKKMKFKIDENAYCLVGYSQLDGEQLPVKEIEEVYEELLEKGKVLYDKIDDDELSRALIVVNEKAQAFIISVVSTNKRTVNEIIIFEIPLHEIPNEILNIDLHFKDSNEKKVN